MRRQSHRHYTVAEYLAIEQSSSIKHEFLNGEILAMVGASRNHNRIVRNLLSALNTALRDKNCEAFANDLRLLTPSGLYTYPDLMVICGEIAITTDPLETVTDPILLIEVLSTSTRSYDRGEKFELYRAIPTLQDYILIEQSKVEIEHRHLSDNSNWLKQFYSSLDDELQISTIDFAISLSAIYERVKF